MSHSVFPVSFLRETLQKRIFESLTHFSFSPDLRNRDLHDYTAPEKVVCE